MVYDPNRKPQLCFDVSPHPEHVTFDDGKGQRRNLPWMRYSETLWDYEAEPDVLKVLISDWMIVIMGQRLGPLYQAIETRSLVRLCAFPKYQNQIERSMDTFATAIAFLRPIEPPKRKGQSQLDLRIE